MSSPRLRLIAVLIVLVPLGLATKVYSGPGAGWVVAHAGGAVYVVFWTLLALAVRPDLPATRVALCVLLVTCLLEFLQLWHPPLLEAARRPFLGQALLGSTFSWSDFPYYVAGALVAAWAGARLKGKAASDDPEESASAIPNVRPPAANRSSPCRRYPRWHRRRRRGG